MKYYNKLTIEEVLEKNFSKSKIKRFCKEGSIKIGKWDGDIFIYIGSKYKFVIVNVESEEKGEYNLWNSAQQAKIVWEYHYQLIPKIAKWEQYKV